VITEKGKGKVEKKEKKKENADQKKGTKPAPAPFIHHYLYLEKKRGENPIGEEGPANWPTIRNSSFRPQWKKGEEEKKEGNAFKGSPSLLSTILKSRKE